jgi:hypothetical protein
MAEAYKAMITISAANGLIEDAVVNTWGLGMEVADEVVGFSQFKTAIQNFYGAIITSLATTHVWNTPTIKLYRLSDPKPRTPAISDVLAVPGTKAGTTSPAELALCVSFQGGAASGLNQRRRRGRIYLGPFAGSATDGLTGRPSSSFITSVRTAAGNLLTASKGTGLWNWSVISTVAGPPYSPVEVLNGWVDDAWDIQRRRGIRPATRGAFT